MFCLYDVYRLFEEIFVANTEYLNYICIMDQRGTIEIRVSGHKGNLELSPDIYDIREIVQIFDAVESILFSGNKKQRPEISYSIESGSVRHVFKTSFQTIVATSAVLASVLKTGSIDKLDLPTARAIEKLQANAISKNYEFSITTSEWQDGELRITPDTHYNRSSEIWVDAEVYLYGTLTDAGGKDKSNIHLDTKEFGQVTIDSDRDYLKNFQENLLYKEFGVRARGKQSLATGEIDMSSLRLISLQGYRPVYDEDYLNGLIAKASKSWAGVDVDSFISDLRGYE